MQRFRRVALAGAASGVLAAGAITAFALTSGNATATTAGSCQVSATTTTCTVPEDISAPSSIELVATASDDDLSTAVTLSWTSVCDLGSTSQPETGPATTSTISTASPTVFDNVNMGITDPTTCSVTATLASTALTGSNTATVSIDYNPQAGASVSASPSASASASPSASPSPATSATSVPPAVTVHKVQGFDGKCLDDKGNSSAKRTEIILWTCSSTDKAESWTYTSSHQLKINGMCVNVKGSAVSRSLLILWNCSTASNEVWKHTSSGEYQLKDHDYKLCLNDPGFGTRNGTKLIVYSCDNGPNEHWGLP
jgi:hypothetical protein